MAVDSYENFLLLEYDYEVSSIQSSLHDNILEKVLLLCDIYWLDTTLHTSDVDVGSTLLESSLINVSTCYGQAFGKKFCLCCANTLYSCYEVNCRINLRKVEKERVNKNRVGWFVT